MVLRKLRTVASIMLLAILAAACNPVPPELRLVTMEAFTPDWCRAAKELPNHGGSLANVAKCHERGVAGFPKDRNVYVFYYTQAARWGDPDGGASLARLGEPLPDNDLQREAQARAERERNMRILANALRPAAAPQPSRPTMFPSAQPVRVDSGSSFSRRINESVNERRVCTNNVCRTERTVCRDGQCRTMAINN